MAAPVKNLLAPTSISNIDLTNILKKPTFITGNINNPSRYAMNLLSSPLFFNQLGTRFLFISAINNVDLTNILKKPTFITGNIKTLSKTSMYMLTNTFPAVYQPANIRPYYGLLYPRGIN